MNTNKKCGHDNCLSCPFPVCILSDKGKVLAHYLPLLKPREKQDIQNGNKSVHAAEKRKLINARRREAYRENRPRELKRVKAYYEKNRERIIARSKRYYEENRKEINDYQTKYRRAKKIIENTDVK